MCRPYSPLAPCRVDEDEERDGHEEHKNARKLKTEKGEGQKESNVRHYLFSCLVVFFVAILLLFLRSVSPHVASRPLSQCADFTPRSRRAPIDDDEERAGHEKHKNARKNGKKEIAVDFARVKTSNTQHYLFSCLVVFFVAMLLLFLRSVFARASREVLCRDEQTLLPAGAVPIDDIDEERGWPRKTQKCAKMERRKLRSTSHG